MQTADSRGRMRFASWTAGNVDKRKKRIKEQNVSVRKSVEYSVQKSGYFVQVLSLRS